MKRRVTKKKVNKAKASAKASVVVNIDNRKRVARQKPAKRGVAFPTGQSSDIVQSFGGMTLRGDSMNNLKAQAKLIRTAVQPIIEQLNLQNNALNEVQNTLLDDALRKNMSLLQSSLNQPAFKSGGGKAKFSPSGELTPNTQILVGVEKAKSYLKMNVEHMPKVSTGKGRSRNYTADEIDKLQAKRIQELYQQTKQNIQRLSADEEGWKEANDPETGFSTPDYTTTKFEDIQNKLSTGKKLGREEYKWLADLGMLGLVPEDAFKLEKKD
jgi:hypothetical protein